MADAGSACRTTRRFESRRRPPPHLLTTPPPEPHLLTTPLCRRRCALIPSGQVNQSYAVVPEFKHMALLQGRRKGKDNIREKTRMKSTEIKADHRQVGPTKTKNKAVIKKPSNHTHQNMGQKTTGQNVLTGPELQSKRNEIQRTRR
jgi:hypothetical protein